jgi:hypothetical protein
MPIVSNQPGVVAFSHSGGRLREIGPSPTPTKPLAQPPPVRSRIAETAAERTPGTAARLEVQLHDKQWLWHEAERQLVERRQRTQEQSGPHDQDE